MDEQTAAIEYTKGKSQEDATAYSSNYKAHKKGISKEEMVKAYSEWSKDGKYEEVSQFDFSETSLVDFL